MTVLSPKIAATPLVLVALSLALNLYALGTRSFWGDEILTASYAQRSSSEVIRWTAKDIHPPLYYLMAGTFAGALIPLGLTESPTEVSDWLWRFPSVVAVVLSVAVTSRLAGHMALHAFKQSNLRLPSSSSTRCLGRQAANSAALLLCLAPVAIQYGQEARMHALFMLTSALSTWLFFRAMRHPDHKLRWLLFGLATTAMIYTMYFGFLILTAQAAYLLASIIDLRSGVGAYPPGNRPSRPIAQLVGFSGAAIFSFLLYIPWWPVLFDLLRRRTAVGAIEGGVGQPAAFAAGVVEALGPEPAGAAWGFMALFIVGLIYFARDDWPMAVFGLLWFVLPVVLPLVVGDPRALQFRYAFVLPVYVTVIAYAAVNIGRSITRRWSPTAFHRVPAYLIWLLATISFIATLTIYSGQVKPNWRDAAAYLDDHAHPADIVLIGPLWDEGRFLDYYYRGQAQLLTPAAMVANIEGRVEGLRAGGGRMWAVNRFSPAETSASRNIVFDGVVISEPQIPVYEPNLLSGAALDLAAQAVEAAYPWARAAEAQGVLDPDPRTAQAAALRAWGDSLMAAGRPHEAVETYQTAVDIFPGWVNGFIALAEAHEATGNVQEAAIAYQQAVQFNLEWQGPQADEAASLAKARNWPAALQKYHHIIED